MSLMSAADRQFAETVSQLSYCNPFLPERIELEREALGDEFRQRPAVWNIRFDLKAHDDNIHRLALRVGQLADALRGKLAEGKRVDREELRLYDDLASYTLYDRYREALYESMADPLEKSDKGAAPRPACWKPFLQDFRHYFDLPPCESSEREAEHLFACIFQLRRAFNHIFNYIVGGSMAAARLRASIWQSIFTHDMRRYRRTLYQSMADITTLVTGPSGTGKELVARAIGLSRYIPFDAKSGRFQGDFAGEFHALNLSALSPTLIESELFGHMRGSFTGAVADRNGWLEICGPLGTVFLDEIGELDAAIQVKLLRVLQSRTFQRLGDTQDRHFQGKIIAATNRDLAQQMRTGEVRADFYYRLCSDIITTPSLTQQLSQSPDELVNLVMFICGRIAGEEADSLSGEVLDWIENHLGRNYAWPGNIRELEQCVRNVLVRREYHPSVTISGNDPHQRLLDELRDGQLTAEQLLSRYCTLMYARLGSYEAAARRLQIDRRTVKAKIDEEFLAELTGDS